MSAQIIYSLYVLRKGKKKWRVSNECYCVNFKTIFYDFLLTFKFLKFAHFTKDCKLFFVSVHIYIYYLTKHTSIYNVYMFLQQFNFVYKHFALMENSNLTTMTFFYFSISLMIVYVQYRGALQQTGKLEYIKRKYRKNCCNEVRSTFFTL